MPDAVTVFIATYSITEMASRLDSLFKKSKTQEAPTPGFSFVMRKCHHSYSSFSLKESWLNRIFKLSLVQHTWLKQLIPLVIRTWLKPWFTSNVTYISVLSL